MSAPLFFDHRNYLEKLQILFPKGRFYKNIHNPDSNTYKLLKWYAFCFEVFSKYLDFRYKSFFISEGDGNLDKFKNDFNIPNDFLKSDAYFNTTDIYVLTYLCNDNKKENYQKIANAYGVRAAIFKDENNPKSVKVKFYYKVESNYIEEGDIRKPEYDFHYFDNQLLLRIEKFMRYASPIDTNIEFLNATSHEIANYKLDPLEPDFISLKIAGEYVKYKIL